MEWVPGPPNNSFLQKNKKKSVIFVPIRLSDRSHQAVISQPLTAPLFRAAFRALVKQSAKARMPNEVWHQVSTCPNFLVHAWSAHSFFYVLHKHVHLCRGVAWEAAGFASSSLSTSIGCGNARWPKKKKKIWTSSNAARASFHFVSIFCSTCNQHLQINFFAEKVSRVTCH